MIDDMLKTSNDKVFAIGDAVALNIKAAYMSEYFANLAVKNALLNKKRKVLTFYSIIRLILITSQR